MEILKRLEIKVKSAVKEIEELRGKVKELEEIKACYEQKTKEMLEEIDLLDLLDESEAEAEAEENLDIKESSGSPRSLEGAFNISSPSL